MAKPGLHQPSDRRHFLRRFVFSATPDLENAVQSRTPAEAVGLLIDAAKNAPSPPVPVARGKWVNRALRYPDTTPSQLTALNNEVAKANLQAAEQIREAWLQEMISGPAPLRENLVLFLHSVFGGSFRTIDGPQALYGYLSVLRNGCLGTIPDLVDALALDPGMMMQENYDEARKELPSEYSARQILDKWTVGPKNYTDKDAQELARALTGWVLEAAPGDGPIKALDPRGFRANRRTGLVPTLQTDLVDDEPKTIFGVTRNFSLREAVRFAATQKAAGRQWSRLMIRYFGVSDSAGKLETKLAAIYESSKGSVEAMLRELATSDEFWSDDSRWLLIKSPVHLAVAACRQLGLSQPPIPAISAWLATAGHRLLDAPKQGAEGWAGQQTWLDPADRLAARYELGDILAKADLRGVSIRDCIDRLDPAPGLDRRSIERNSKQARDAARQVLATPESQVA